MEAKFSPCCALHALLHKQKKRQGTIIPVQQGCSHKSFLSPPHEVLVVLLPPRQAGEWWGWHFHIPLPWYGPRCFRGFPCISPMARAVAHWNRTRMPFELFNAHNDIRWGYVRPVAQRNTGSFKWSSASPQSSFISISLHCFISQNVNFCLWKPCFGEHCPTLQV